MVKTYLVLVALSLFLTIPAFAVDPSYCNLAVGDCPRVCQTWEKAWTGKVDPQVCCEVSNGHCLMWGCFCE